MFIQRPDAELHVLSFNQGPLTLLAAGGWTGNGEIWLDLFGHLPHWRCVAVDHRVTGSSTQCGPITLEAMADDVLAVADELPLESCVLAAESAGAAVASRAVQKAPSRFLALPRLNVPTLLLHGTQDRIVPVAASRRLAAHLAQCALHELPGMGHVPIVTAPRDMASRIDAFGQRWTPVGEAAHRMP